VNAPPPPLLEFPQQVLPQLVGHRLIQNALAVTIAMMFWAWLWGGVGLVLAVPITAAIKAVCDNVERLKPFGAWMGERL